LSRSKVRMAYSKVVSISSCSVLCITCSCNSIKLQGLLLKRSITYKYLLK
jgi:hypothetical protein